MLTKDNMIFDFSKTCKTYDANLYGQEDLLGTRCPGCGAMGRFKLHGSYHRYAAYFNDAELLFVSIEIKRVKCLSCKATHAIVPCDIIPYRLLTLFAILAILGFYYLHKKSVLKIAREWEFSHQFIYSIIEAFRMHASRIYLYFREKPGGITSRGFDMAGIMALVCKSRHSFQSGYLELYRRPCFMCKFFDNPTHPRIGRLLLFTGFQMTAT